MKQIHNMTDNPGFGLYKQPVISHTDLGIKSLT